LPNFKALLRNKGRGMESLFAVKKVLLLHAKSPKERVFKAEIIAEIIVLIFVEGKYLSSCMVAYYANISLY
jgi:hypothetical protein